MSDTKHRLMLEDRSSLLLNGVKNVDSFDEMHIELSGSFGSLDIDGEDMKIASLDLDEGKISISGLIGSFAYGQAREDKKIRNRSKKALSRLLK